jgi:hypothetical protein
MKREKVADAVLAQVQPSLDMVSRFGGVAPAALSSDKFVLGFLCMTIGIVQQQVAKTPLSAEDKGRMLFLVLHHLFGTGAINEREVGDLMHGFPTRNQEFTEGNLAAYRIQAVSAGSPALDKDPDVVGARESVRLAGGSLDIITPGATENSKVTGELLRVLFYQRVVERYGRGSE